MAIFRLHRKEWERDLPAVRRPLIVPKAAIHKTPAEPEKGNKFEPATEAVSSAGIKVASKKRKAPADSDSEERSASPEQPPATKLNESPQPSFSKKPETKGRLSKSSIHPGGGRRGVSSGLTTVVKHKTTGKTVHRVASAPSHLHSTAGKKKNSKSKNWWKSLE